MVNDKEYIIFCDESDKRGKYYSNFYGGVLVGSSDYDRITIKLNDIKTKLNLFGEVKWEKVTERYLDKYLALIAQFFKEVKANHVKIRIMFTQNAKIPKGLKRIHIEEEYFILYYHFIKNAFGLGSLPSGDANRNLRLYFDMFPQQKREKIEKFKAYLASGIQTNHYFRKSKILLRKDNITEIKSHDHVLLQCLDIVLGSMSFRLNDKHKELLPGSKRREKKQKQKKNFTSLF